MNKLIDGLLAVVVFLVALCWHDVFGAWEFVKDYWLFGEWHMSQTLAQHEEH